MIKNEEELSLKRNINSEDMIEFAYKKEVVKNSKLSERLFTFCSFCILPIVVIYPLISIFNPALLATKMALGILVGSSLSFGLITNYIVEKKFLKLKPKLREFSDSKTEEKLLEEETRYEIMYEIAKNRNLAIDKALEILNLEEQRKINMEETESKNIDLELQKLNNNLTIFTKRKILATKFWKYRSKIQPIIECLVFSVLIASLTTLLINFPFMTTSLLSLLAPFPISLLVGTIYTAKTTKENRRVYKKLNEELRHDALPKKRNYEKEKEFEIEINKIIDSICNLYVESMEYNKLINQNNNEEIEKENQNTISKQYTQECFNRVEKKEMIKILIKK